MNDIPTSFKDVELLILDMDGVLTSEQAYWDVAGLVVRDILESSAFLGLSPPDYSPISDLFYQRLLRGSRNDWRKYLPKQLIVNAKARGINSNWDLAYLTAGIYLAHLFSPFSMYRLALNPNPNSLGRDLEATESGENDSVNIRESLLPVWNRLKEVSTRNDWPHFLRLGDFHLWGNYFRKQNRRISPIDKIELRIMDDFHPKVSGIRLLEELNHLVENHDCQTRFNLFGRNTDLWDDCRDLFQEWYLGDDLYRQTYGREVKIPSKPGLIHREEPLNGSSKTHACLSKLRDCGVRLAIATGRPRMEIMTPLEEWEMSGYFEPDRIVTHCDIESAEAELRAEGIDENLGKPHPFGFLKALYPEKSAKELWQLSDHPIPDPHKTIIVGDALADIWAASKIGCPSVALLSGVMGKAGKRQLEEANPNHIGNDLIELANAIILLKESN